MKLVWMNALLLLGCLLGLERAEGSYDLLKKFGGYRDTGTNRDYRYGTNYQSGSDKGYTDRGNYNDGKESNNYGQNGGKYSGQYRYGNNYQSGSSKGYNYKGSYNDGKESNDYGQNGGKYSGQYRYGNNYQSGSSKGYNYKGSYNDGKESNDYGQNGGKYSGQYRYGNNYQSGSSKGYNYKGSYNDGKESNNYGQNGGQYDGYRYDNGYNAKSGAGGYAGAWWEKLKNQVSDKLRGYSDNYNRQIYQKHDPRDVSWNTMDKSDWGAWWAKITAWKKSLQETEYNAKPASCSDGKVLQCWTCDKEDEKDCRPDEHGNKWQTCKAGESCFTEYTKVLEASSYGGQAWVKKVSRGCMALSTCKVKQCKDCWQKENCRDCGGKCWSRCDHPKCPRPVQCRKCDKADSKEDCYANSYYETCTQDDAVCQEAWSCDRYVGSTFSCGCSDRVTCYSKKDASDDNNRVGLVDCKSTTCPPPPKPTPKPTTPKPTTPKPTTAPPSCPGPGEDYIDFKDRAKMTMSIEGPEAIVKRKATSFLRGAKGSALFLIKPGVGEANTIVMKFKGGESYNIVKLDFETNRANWIDAVLYKGKKQQHTARATPNDPNSGWVKSSVEVSEKNGKGITKIIFKFEYQTGELQARNSFLTICP